MCDPHNFAVVWDVKTDRGFKQMQDESTGRVLEVTNHLVTVLALPAPTSRPQKSTFINIQTGTHRFVIGVHRMEMGVTTDRCISEPNY